MRQPFLWLAATSLAALLSGCVVVEGRSRSYPRHPHSDPSHPVYQAPGHRHVAPPAPRHQWRDDDLEHRHERRKRTERRDKDRDHQARGRERDRDQERRNSQRGDGPRRGPPPAHLHREASGGL